jgi:predicted RNA binding protein YcfA (HicA-like mRNA interferase family)
MKLPRDLGGDTLASKLGRIGYRQTRQTGSHVRLTRDSPDGQHHVTIPRHHALRVGTLNAILTQIAGHLGIDQTELLQKISK